MASELPRILATVSFKINWAKLLAFLCCGISWGVVTSVVFAGLELENVPSQIVADVSQTVTVRGSLDNETEYYLKARFGQDSELNRGQTLNPTTGQWLNDGNSWDAFYSFKTDAEGKISSPIQLQFKAKPEVTAGNYSLVVRAAKKDNTSSQANSSSVAIQVVESVNNNSSPTPTPTTTPTANPTATPTPTPTAKPSISNIRIEEIYSSPNSDEKEWLEFYNDNSDSVNLQDWYVIDDAGTKKSLGDFQIPGKGSAYLEFASGFLNNGGEKIKLMDSSTVKFEVTYPEVEKGKSWSQVNGQWCKTNPSRGYGNNTCLTSVSEDEDHSTSPSPSSTVTATAATTSPTASKQKQDSRVLLAKKAVDRQLPVLQTSQASPTERSASVAGVSTQIPLARSPKLMVPLIIAFAGLGLLGAAAYPFAKPALLPYLDRIRHWKVK